MAIYGNLRDHKFSSDVDDIRGSKIYNLQNEDLGKIDDVIFDSSSGELAYLVIDTGGWLSSNRFLVPARQIITDTEGDERNFRVNLTKDQIKTFPAYDEKQLIDESGFGKYEKDYSKAYGLTGDVLHREGSTHMLTPDASEMPASSGGSAGGRQPMHRIAQDMPRFGATSSSDSAGTADLHGNADIEPVIRKPEEIEPTESGNAPVNLSRDEFLKEGSLRSEYDAPSENAMVGSEPVDSITADATGKNSRRFREFQERLRRDREEIMRRRRASDEAA
jgi:hypothetical protein